MSDALLESLKSRRSLKPKYLTTPAPTIEEIREMASAAIHVPDHGRLRPYRFVVIEDDSRAHLADLFEAAARNRGADNEEAARTRSKALKGPVLIAFIVSPNTTSDVLLFEQLLTAGAALGQFMTALHAKGFGGIVLSGDFLTDADLQAAFCDKPTDRIVAWITVGTPAPDAKLEASGTEEAPISSW